MEDIQVKINNLVVCGCSFTHGHQLSTEETWGGYFAKKKNLNFYNIAKGGVGNEWITQQTIGFFENNYTLKKDSLVIIGWTDASRLMGTFHKLYKEPIDVVTIRPNDFIKDNLKNDWSKNIDTYHGYCLQYGETLSPLFNSYLFCILKTYQTIFNLKNYLEINNIPFLFFDAINKNKIINMEINSNIATVTLQDSYGDILKLEEMLDVDKTWLMYFNNNFENKIFDSNWVTFNNNPMLVEMRKNKYDYFTEGNSGHPNHNACDYFSDILIKNFEERYV